MRNLYVFFVLSLTPTALCRWKEEYGRDPQFTKHQQNHPIHQNYQTPLDTMVDVTNDLAGLVLQDYAHTKGNFAFSPYGVASVLVVLYEGARGETARQIHHALRLPWNKDVTRVGFRDIHRNLVSYFTHEGYLSGMTLSKNHTALREDYKRILRFYGYDVDLVKRPDIVVTGSTTREMTNFPPSTGTTPMGGDAIPSSGGTTPRGGETILSSGGTTPRGGEPFPSSAVTTTPKGEDSIPSSGGTTPRGGETILSSGGTTPRGGEAILSSGGTTPRGGETILSSGGTTPRGGETILSSGGTAPIGGEAIPSSAGATTPIGGEAIPSSGGTTPRGGETILSSGGTTPRGGETILSSGGTAPIGGEAIPSSAGATTPIGGEAIPSSGGTTPRGGETILSSGGTTPRGGETILSSGGTAPIGGEAIPSSAVTTTPKGEDIIPSSGGTTPRGGETILSSGGTAPIGGEAIPSSAGATTPIGGEAIPSSGGTTPRGGETINTLTEPSTTDTFSIFTVILPTTPEPEGNSSEENISSEMEDKKKDGDKESNKREGSKVTQPAGDKRMPSSTMAPPAETSEEDLDSLEDITTTTSKAELTTPVEETKDPTIYPSDTRSEEDEDDATTTELSWNLFKDIVTVKPENKSARSENTLPSARTTVDAGVTTPYPKTEDVFEDLPTTSSPLVSSSTEESKNLTYGGKAITLLAKSSTVQVSSRTTSSAPPGAESNETAETRSVPVSEPSTLPETTPTEDLAVLEKKSNLTDVVPPEANTTSVTEKPQAKRSIRSIRRGSNFPNMALELDNSMYDSHVNQGSELYTQLPRFTFLVDGVHKEDVPVMAYTTIFPFAYVSKLNSLAMEFPLDDSRYKLLLLLPIQPRGLPHLIHELKHYSLRLIHEALQPTRVNAIIPSFMVEGFVILTPALQQLGIWDVFDPRRCDLSGMSADPELYVRNVEQSITVVIRNYMEVLDIHTRTTAGRTYTEKFFVTHPFLYFVLDAETHVALMAGKIIDPLNSRIY